MLLWVTLIGGLALMAAAIALVFATGRAERRARRALFRRLGLSEATIELLMARNGDIPAELELVRRHDQGSGAEPAAERPEPSAKPAIRLVHPTAGEAAATPPPRDPHRPPGDRRRLRLPGRRP
jgi:hypothetical protein